MPLIVAYGNPRRGDDAVAWRIAERLASAAPHVETITRPGLVPELADEIALASLVVFVDVKAGGKPGDVSCRRVTPDDAASARGAQTPATLLALASGLSGRAPDAFLVTVSGARFAVGDPLSPAVSAAVDEATSRISALLTTRSRRS